MHLYASAYDGQRFGTPLNRTTGVVGDSDLSNLSPRNLTWVLCKSIPSAASYIDFCINHTEA